MRLESLKIKNFRGLSDIEASFDRDVSVIVGPNAIGKTSLLEAIRLAKGVLAPRWSSEPQVTLNEMGALAQDRLRFNSLAGDIGKPVEILLRFQFSDSDVSTLGTQVNELAGIHVRNSLGIAPGTPDFALAQYLSSVQGQQLFRQSAAEIQSRLATLRQNKEALIQLHIEAGTMRGMDLFAQEFVTALEQTLRPSSSYFTYFPADRALPSGETHVQLGSADAQAQLASHMGQPATKYSRLKNVIVAQMLRGNDARQVLEKDFHTIFESLLAGKRLKGLTLGAGGPLSVLIEDTATGKVYDIDRMSSGEKGLVLQFLLMRQSIAPGALILIDEPELHLNPAICKRLVSFIVDEVITPAKAQAIICTHSPEILADAFERDDCRLFHLRSSTDLSAIHKKDKEEIFEALRRLGASTSDVLFSKGTLFVEGVHDSDLLEEGFPNRVSGFRLMRLRGRSEVEKEIQTLQTAEREGKLKEHQYFIFDNDRRPTSIVTSPLVRILQWDRYCLENFLLDADAIFDVKEMIKATKFPASRGEMKTLLKDLAMRQVDGIVVREVYSTLEPDNAGLRSADLQAFKTFDDTARVLFGRIHAIQEQVSPLTEDEWIKRFVGECEKKKRELTSSWEEAWVRQSDGKRVLVDFHRHVGANISALELKRRIVASMDASQTDSWRVVDSHLADLLQLN